MSKKVVDMTLRANMDLSNIASDVSQIQNYLKKLGLSPDAKRSFDNLFDEALSDLDKLQKKIDKGFKTKGDITGFEKASSSLEASFKKIENKLFKLYNLSDKEIFKLDPKLKGDIEAIERKFANIAEDFPKDIKEGLKNISGEIDKLKTTSQKKAGKEILSKIDSKDYEGALKLAQQKLKKQQVVAKNNPAADKTTGPQIEAYKNIISVLQEAISHIDKFNNKAKYLETEKAERYSQTFNTIKDSLGKAQEVASKASKGFGQVSAGIREAGQETVSFNSELDSIKQRVQYFFSLTNSVMLFRQILRDTIQTTKELDAAMTETAVVTDFSVADMWKDLPRYTSIAKELGTTIKGVYETMTLYYQQGLKTEEVTAVGTETLKMARIAGLDYAQATDFMTAALRGFNMEVNDLNAQKVNDVYSKLAAITAADTQEIATAMTKTASIASSANMEFETTAAFLSQIIETTRESAETAGTALKTVIARFTELKKDPAEIGEVDGEIVDANKIETALRTISVSLRDANGQFRDLDDVFLDIAEKWDGLSVNTQRYIATMAAGSRQQSRFLAMMSDYSRTMELVSAANNSAGASQKQFDKTLESLDSKLNRLKDAWDQFTMGIANNTLIKAGVDALTGLINLLNKITEHLPGPTKGIGNLLLLFGGFKAGEKIFRVFSSTVLADMVALTKGSGDAGTKIGKDFFKGLKKEFSIEKFTKVFKAPTKAMQNMYDEAEELRKENQNLFKKLVNTEDSKEKDVINQQREKNVEQINNLLTKRNTLITDYNELQNLGYGKLLSNLIINKGISLEEVSQLAIARAKDKTDDEEIKNLQKKIILEKLLTKYSSEELGEKLKNYADSVQKEGGIIQKNTSAKLAQWASTKLLAGGYKALIVSLGQFALIAGAVVGAIALISYAIETNEEKEKRLQTAIEHTGESMEESKTAIEDVKTSMEDLGNLDTELDSLVKGTDAWKEKLIEVNDKVLEIINKYPQLAQYMSEDANGKLSISSEGWDEVLAEQKKKLNAATLANTISTQQKNQLDTTKKVKEEIKESGLTKGAATSVETMQLAKRFAKAGKFLTNDEEANAEVLKNTIGLDDDLKAILEKDNGIAEFNKIVGMMKNSNLQLEKSNEVLASHFVNQNQIISDSEYNKGITKLISSKLETDEYGNISSEVVKALNENYGSFGLDGQRFDMNKSKIWEEYAKYTGKTYDEVKEEAKDDANITYSMALELASQEAAEELSKSAELLVKGLNKVGTQFLKTDKQLSNSFKALFNNNLTEKDIANLRANQPEFKDLPKEIKEYFDNNSSAYQKFINEQIKIAEEQLANAGEILATLPAENLDTSKLSAEAMKGLSLELQEVFYRSGEEGVKQITNSLNDIYEDLDQEKADQFTAALNGVDWTSVGSITELKNTLYEMGIYVDDSKLENLTDDLIDFNKATRAVNLEQLISQLESSQDLMEQISERERGDRTFTKEEKQKLTSAGISEDSFVGYGDSWRYVGESISDLIVALQQNTQAILGDTTKQLEEKLKLAQVATEIQGKGEYDLVNTSTLKTSDKQEILANFIKDSGLQTIAGYSADSLSILTSDELSDSQENILNQVLETIASTVGNVATISAELDNQRKQEGIAAYSGKTTAETVAAATGSDPVESEKATNALLYRAAAYEDLGDEIRAYNKAVEAEDKELANNIKKQMGAKIAIQERAKALDTLDDKVETHLQNLKETSKSTQAYKNILGNLTEDINQAFGTNLSSEFFENSPENLALLENALEGSQEAWDALILKIQEAQVKTIDFKEEYDIVANDISGITNALNNLKFSIEGEADMTKVVESLMAAGMSGQQVASFLEKLGYTNIEFEVEGDFDLNSITSLADLEGKTWSLKATNVNIPAAREYSSFGDYGANSGTKSGDSDSGSSWKNPYDSFYNITEDINELLDKRNSLEKEYNALLQDENSTIDDFTESYKNRLASFAQEVALQKQVLAMRQQEQESLLSKNSHLSQYAWVEDGAVYIDFKAIDQVTDEELGGEIEEYISALEENDEAIQEANEAIQDANLAMEELIDEWRDKAANFEQEVFDALVNEREREIEQLEDAAEAVSDSNSNLIDAIQEEINLRRQQRDNEEKEQEIADKERRLAFLSQDTSGAYDQEILQLEKDLTNEKEDYTDTLIDQKISELQKQNDEAQKQREKQIQIMQYQLENDQKTGVIAQEVRKLLQEANSDAGWNRVWNLLEKSAGFKGLTDTNKEVWTEQTRNDFKEAMAYLNGVNGGGIADAISQAVSSAVGDYQYIASQGGSIDDDGDGDGPNGNVPNGTTTPPEEIVPATKYWGQSTKTVKGVDYTYLKEVGTNKNAGWYKNSDFTVTDEEQGHVMLKNGAKEIRTVTAPIQTKITIGKDTYYQVEDLWYKNLTDNNKKTTMTLDTIGTGEKSIWKSEKTKKIVNLGKTATPVSLKSDYGSYKGEFYTQNGIYYLTTQAKKSSDGYITIPAGSVQYTPFKTGGLADFTGPAWLDGTKSKPELVLNQRDTQNFLQLKDVLSSFMKNNQPSIHNEETAGDTIYDINISVEKMSNDYDVEQVANKVKQIISSEAAYRNSNMIQRLR